MEFKAGDQVRYIGRDNYFHLRTGQVYGIKSVSHGSGTVENYLDYQLDNVRPDLNFPTGTYVSGDTLELACRRHLDDDLIACEAAYSHGYEAALAGRPHRRYSMPLSQQLSAYTARELDLWDCGYSDGLLAQSAKEEAARLMADW